MKTVSTELQTLLGKYLTGELTTYYIAELYVFWLKFGLTYNEGFFNSGYMLTYTGLDTDLMVGGNLYRHWSITHGDIQEIRGAETNDTDITINFGADDVIKELDVNWFTAIKSGMFDGCYVSIDRLFSPTKFYPMMGNISSNYVLKSRFFGRMDVDELKSASCKFTVKSPTELFNTQLPRNEILSSCINSFCDSMCTLTKSDYSTTVTAKTGSSKTAIYTGLSLSTGYFAQGSLVCTSGNNAGATRTIKTYNNNIAVPTNPFESTVDVGDTFILYRGCAKTIAACEAYGNIEHIRSFPYVPDQNTLL